MVGGKIIRVWDEGERGATVEVRDGTMGLNGKPIYDYCKVGVEAPASWFTAGDILWWQGGICFWTPWDKSVVEKRLPKRTYSYSDAYDGDGVLVIGEPEPLPT